MESCYIHATELATSPSIEVKGTMLFDTGKLIDCTYGNVGDVNHDYLI